MCCSNLLFIVFVVVVVPALSIIEIVDGYIFPYSSVIFFLNYFETVLLNTYKFNILELPYTLNPF